MPSAFHMQVNIFHLQPRLVMSKTETVDTLHARIDIYLSVYLISGDLLCRFPDGQLAPLERRLCRDFGRV
jgi:hypothetical protein